MTTHMQSVSEVSKPRSGWQGNVDRFIGPGATPAELALQFVPAVAMAIAAPLYAKTISGDFTGWQLGLIAFLAFDFMGGVLTNATAAAKRWYHRPGQGWQQHLSFVALHLVHIAVVAIAFRGMDWLFFIGVSSYLLLAASMILDESSLSATTHCLGIIYFGFARRSLSHCANSRFGMVFAFAIPKAFD